MHVAKNVRPFLILSLFVLAVVVPLSLTARGRGETDRSVAPVSEPDDGADAGEAPRRSPIRDGATEEMRRLSRIGAGLRTTGGRSTDVELPERYHGQSPPRGAHQFSTDFSRALIDYSDVVAGGPPKDGIPSIDFPVFETVTVADEWLADAEPVIVVRRDGETAVYPLQILTWHEIVNDEIAGHPVSVTYCPLCNTGVAFDRRFDDLVLDFGVSGLLVFSNMIMYDRQTETWWVQATGRGVAGKFAGQQLAFVPSTLVSWSDARETHPDARVLSRETGHRRDYGSNPYVGYDGAYEPFLYRGAPVVDTETESPMTRVLTVYHGGDAAAYPFPILAERRVIETLLDGKNIVVLWEEGTSSALDTARLAEGRDVGTANAFYPDLNGRTLTFEVVDGEIRDKETGSRWNAAGSAVEGPLTGEQLEPALAIHHFLFSWRAFHPE
ncbi:MAG: DUF3179 domain-containing protein [Spirochaetaceae bacterium]|nr:MAG: DUF3179 domain-containing protein [Spirochaetaceae bacterium]